MRLVLVRHGETPSNVLGALDTAPPGAPLTPLGHRQADAVPAALRDEPIVAVHASPLVRTRLSAAPLAAARGLDVVVTDGLEEIRAGELEMHTAAESIEAYAATVAAWIRGDLTARMPGAEDGQEFLERYAAAVRAITTGHPDDATVVAFSHGAAIRTFASLHGGPQEERLLNTGAVILEGAADAGWAVVGWSREPLGGPQLVDAAATDPTGQADISRG